jgi:hypothetical protein
MKTSESVLSAHPFATAQSKSGTFLSALRSIAECIEACTSCADACLAEENVGHLRRCVRTNLDCADICTATLRVFSRQTESNGELLHAQLHACIQACDICADECGKHRRMHEHCAKCAKSCRTCQEACNLLLGEISSAGTAGNSDDAAESV